MSDTPPFSAPRRPANPASDKTPSLRTGGAISAGGDGRLAPSLGPDTASSAAGPSRPAPLAAGGGLLGDHAGTPAGGGDQGGKGGGNNGGNGGGDGSSGPEKDGKPGAKKAVAARKRSTSSPIGWLYTLGSLAYTGAIAGFATAVGVTAYFTADLPSYDWLATYEPALVTRVHAADGRLMGEFATERRVFVPIASIPKHVADAFLAAEDKNFYDHPGIDVTGIGRAIVVNLENFAHGGHRLVGASTITQQVARNLLLTLDQRFDRKIKEIILSLRIEQILPKDRILELYLNEIYLGQRSYGVAAAALSYFDKSLDNLTIAEAAYLAALPKGPNNYNPVTRRQAALDRRNWVIGRMFEDGRITHEQAEAALAEPFNAGLPRDTETVQAGYFAEEVRRELIDKYGRDALYEQGYSVRTTMDPRLQEIARRSLRDGLVEFDRREGYRGPITHFASMDDWKKQLTEVSTTPGDDDWRLAVVLEVSRDKATIGFSDGSHGTIKREWITWARRFITYNQQGPAVGGADDVLKVGDVIYAMPMETLDGKKLPEGSFALRQIPKVEGGMVAMDPHTGRVLALVGGFSYNISQYNRATQAMRQTGSAFKPFVYLAALERGFTPSTIIDDDYIELEQGPGLPLWTPGNYHGESLGPTTFREGVEKSKNMMTVRLAAYIGMQPISDVGERFGIYDKMPPYLSYALGAGETTVLRLTNAYAMLVNGGKRIQPTLIDRIQDRYGHTIYRHDERPCTACENVTFDPSQPVPNPPDEREQVVDPRYAYQMVSIMEGVIQRGTGVRIASLGRPLAGKTGTSNDSKDTWFVGFSPDLAVGVYVGYDQPASLGKSETGSSVAAPIWKEFMGDALKDTPAIPFRVPPGLVMTRVNVDTGQPPELGDPARKVIWEAFLPGSEPEPGAPVQMLDSIPGDEHHRVGFVPLHGGTGVYVPVSQGGPDAARPNAVPQEPVGQTPLPLLNSGTGGIY
ncbi:penicillin-binding protein 1A [Radicibacter daui]|uniref:penicillin-binding protein 1A n=1 Tax=Radicibacter daui TaxID=3064829 RepID=UPI004046BD73